MEPVGKCTRRVASIGDVIDDVTRLHDVILLTSQYSKSSHSEIRTRINYPCGPFKAAHTIVERCVKNQLIRLRTLGEEAFFGVTLPSSENCQ